MVYTACKLQNTRRGTRAQTTRPGLFGPKVSFLIYYFVFFCTNLCFTVIVGCILQHTREAGQ